jgi:hypothetical protein
MFCAGKTVRKSFRASGFVLTECCGCCLCVRGRALGTIREALIREVMPHDGADSGRERRREKEGQNESPQRVGREGRDRGSGGKGGRV